MAMKNKYINPDLSAYDKTYKYVANIMLLVNSVISFIQHEHSTLHSVFKIHFFFYHTNVFNYCIYILLLIQHKRNRGYMQQLHINRIRRGSSDFRVARKFTVRIMIGRILENVRMNIFIM